jgi:hypothetical protein
MRLQQLIQKFLPQPAQTLERRLHRRALQYWQNALGDDGLVRLADFDPLAIEDDFSHGFLLDVRAPIGPRFSYVGPVLEQEAGVSGINVLLAGVRADSLLMRFASHYPRVLDSGAPETAEYDFVTDAGYHVLCRGALLPLSSDGVTLDHVYGVVSWKSERVTGQS